MLKKECLFGRDQWNSRYRFSVKAVTYLRVDKVNSDENGKDTPQYVRGMLKTLTAGYALLHYKTTLKVRVSVVLTRNIDQCKGHVNGAHYILRAFRTNLLVSKS